MGINSNSTNAIKIWAALMKAGALTGCHQKYDRSLKLKGFQLPLCARCTGLLAGQLAAFAAYPFYSRIEIVPLAVTTAVSIFLLGTDGLGQLKGLWMSNNPRRLVTGLFCGFCTTALFLVLMSVLLGFVWHN